MKVLVLNTFSDLAKKRKPKFVGRKRPSTPEKSGSSERESSPASKQGSKSPQRLHMGRKLSGSSASSRKSDLRARYWCYLFDNLKRAVDEIYCTCESDESTVECQVMAFISYLPEGESKIEFQVTHQVFSLDIPYLYIRDRMLPGFPRILGEVWDFVFFQEMPAVHVLLELWPYSWRTPGKLK